MAEESILISGIQVHQNAEFFVLHLNADEYYIATTKVLTFDKTLDRYYGSGVYLDDNTLMTYKSFPYVFNREEKVIRIESSEFQNKVHRTIPSDRKNLKDVCLYFSDELKANEALFYALDERCKQQAKATEDIQNAYFKMLEHLNDLEALTALQALRLNTMKGIKNIPNITVTQE